MTSSTAIVHAIAASLPSNAVPAPTIQNNEMCPEDCKSLYTRVSKSTPPPPHLTGDRNKMITYHYSLGAWVNTTFQLISKIKAFNPFTPTVRSHLATRISTYSTTPLLSWSGICSLHYCKESIAYKNVEMF